MRSTTLRGRAAISNRLFLAYALRGRIGLAGIFLLACWIMPCANAVAQVYNVNYFEDTQSDGTRVLFIWMPRGAMARLQTEGLKSASIPPPRAGRGFFTDRSHNVWQADPYDGKRHLSSSDAL
jgi:hypothetical protein